MADYLKNADLLGEVIKFQSTSDENIRRHARDKLLVMFHLMATNIATKYRKLDPSWREDMISEAMMEALSSAGKFDPSKGSNAFAYYTSCIKTAFKHFNRKESDYKKRFIGADFYDALGKGEVVE